MIVDYIKKNNKNIHDTLEIGCSNGWRLSLLNRIYPKAVLHGIDPSKIAIEDGTAKYPNINLKIGTADELPFPNKFFSNIIDFCIYLNDRALLFKVAEEVDRILSNNGTWFILDFLPKYPRTNVYSHDTRIKSSKMNYSEIFLWHPSNNLFSQNSFSHISMNFHPEMDERIGLTVLRKII